MSSFTKIKAFVPGKDASVEVCIYNDGVTETDKDSCVVRINGELALVEEFHTITDDEACEEDPLASIHPIMKA